MFSFELSSCVSSHRWAQAGGGSAPARILHTLTEESDCAPEEGVSTQTDKTTKKKVLGILTSCEVRAVKRDSCLDVYPAHWLEQECVCPHTSVLSDVHVHVL